MVPVFFDIFEFSFYPIERFHTIFSVFFKWERVNPPDATGVASSTVKLATGISLCIRVYFLLSNNVSHL